MDANNGRIYDLSNDAERRESENAKRLIELSETEAKYLNRLPEDERVPALRARRVKKNRKPLWFGK